MRYAMRSRFGFLLVPAALLLAGCGSTSAPPTAPTVTSTTPASGATGVAIGSTVTATFSEAMTASTISSSTFTLTQGGNAVAGAVSYNSTTNTATFTPSASLANNTQYTATITTGATASNNAALASNDSWSFTTVAGPAPTATPVAPTNASTGVSIVTTVTVTFSEPINPSTLTTSTFTLTTQGGSAIAGTVTYDSATMTATFTPSAPLNYNTMYFVVLTTGIVATNGTPMAQGVGWDFTTALPPAPTVMGVTPANGATNISASTPGVSATFSEAMNASTLSTSTFTLTSSNGPVAGTVAYDSGTMTATFTPAANLAANTVYTATITTGATAANTATLAANYTWSFTTALPLPTVTSATPTTGLTSVAIGTTVTATFSEAMTGSTLTTSTFTLSSSGGAVTGTVSYDSGSMTATFTPSANLAYATTYTATITTGAQDSAGGALASNYTWTFTTVGQYTDAVDFGTTFQTIRGFGGSTAWLGTMPPAVATALFSPTNGLGLSILRVRIDPTGNPSGAGSANGYPYEDYSWDEEATNGTEAVQNNPNAIVFATPWTPPAAWKLNGTSITVSGNTFNEAYNASCGEGTGYCGGYLDPNHYADYADYLEDFVTFYNSQNTNPLYAISMQNEPEENTSYESCIWTPAQMDTWVAGNASTITTDPYSTKFMMPEADSFQTIQAAPTLNDTNAEGFVSIIGGHLYGVSPAPYSIPNGDSPKEIWMTEFGPLSSATLPWASTTAQSALDTFALSIHNSLVTGQYNAYVWWGVFGASTGSCATSAGTCGLVDDSGNVLPMGYVFGQYSKFIQPGYVRASATASPTAGVYVSAFTGTESGTQHYVIVAINTSTTAAQSVTFTLQNAGSITSMTPWQSTSSAGLQQQTAVPVTASGQVTLSLPISSITTLEY